MSQPQGRAPTLAAARSAPVNTASTPGAFFAWAVLIEPSTACACGERTNAACVCPAKATSSVSCPAPVRTREFSLWGTLAPNKELVFAASYLFGGGNGGGPRHDAFDD